MGPAVGAGLRSTSEFVNTDLTGKRQEYIFKPPKIIENWLLSQLRDERDAPMAYLLFNICTVSVPIAASLFLVPNLPHLVGLLFFVLNLVLFTERFILCLHYSEHVQVAHAIQPIPAALRYSVH